jgi:hypothetical protein
MVVQSISQPQHPLHVGARITKHDFQEADIVRQYANEALEGLWGLKICTRGVSLDVRW